MAAGRSQRMHCHQHPGSGHDAGIDGVAQADVYEVAAAHVAYRCESGQQRLARVRRRPNRVLGHGAFETQKCGSVVVGVELVGKMRMGIDEPRQQRGIPQIDHCRPGWDRPPTDGLNPSIRNHHQPRFHQCACGAVE